MVKGLRSRIYTWMFRHRYWDFSVSLWTHKECEAVRRPWKCRIIGKLVHKAPKCTIQYIHFIHLQPNREFCVAREAWCVGRGVFSIQFFNIIRGWILSNAEYLCISSATQYRVAIHITRFCVRRPKESSTILWLRVCLASERPESSPRQPLVETAARKKNRRKIVKSTSNRHIHRVYRKMVSEMTILQFCNSVRCHCWWIWWMLRACVGKPYPLSSGLSESMPNELCIYAFWARDLILCHHSIRSHPPGIVRTTVGFICARTEIPEAASRWFNGWALAARKKRKRKQRIRTNWVKLKNRRCRYALRC